MKINLKDKSLLILIAVNIFPIIGVLFLGWSSISVIFIYIIETVIIGLFNIPKMIMAKADFDAKLIKNKELSSPITGQKKTKETKEGCLKAFLIPFFLIHYNFFIVIQGIFIYFIAKHIGQQEVEPQSFLTYDYLLSILFIVGSHAYSFYNNYVKKEEYKKASAIKLMFAPYKRIMIQQVTVLAGSFLIFYFEAPIIFMLVLIFLKIFFDVRAHYKDHHLFSELDNIGS